MGVRHGGKVHRFLTPNVSKSVKWYFGYMILVTFSKVKYVTNRSVSPIVKLLILV